MVTIAEARPTARPATTRPPMRAPTFFEVDWTIAPMTHDQPLMICHGGEVSMRPKAGKQRKDARCTTCGRSSRRGTS